MSKLFKKFSLYELVVTAVMAALGIAIKPLVVPLAHIVCGPLMIPSGALAGGLYMMWLVIGYGMVKKPGASLIISIIQAMLVIFTGVVGSHGIMSLLTYILPGLAVEIVMLVSRHRACCVTCCAIAGLFANVAGTTAVNVVFFQAPGVYLVLILALSSVSGLAGGVIAWELIKAISRIEANSKAGLKISGWVEDIDKLSIESETSNNVQTFQNAQEHTKVGFSVKRDGGRKWILALAMVLSAVVGITALINANRNTAGDNAITVLVNGEVVASFEMAQIMKLDAVTENINLSSGSKEAVSGDFKGTLLSTVLKEAGAKVDEKTGKLYYAEKEYSTVLLTAGDNYSSAADEDEISRVMIAYEQDGETLGHYSNGGTGGPLRAIFLYDNYGNRSVMNIVKIDLR